MTRSKNTNVAREILAYLVEHPEAQDTAEGIAEWWILEQCVKRQSPLVDAALRDLLAKRLIVARKTSDARIHYRVNRSRLGEIRALIGKKK